jgi:mRNA interferase MazF
MPTFKAGDVVRVPFPYTDKTTRQHRPALVVAADELETDHGLIWVCMVTSAMHRAWRSDVPINDLRLAGLPVPSVVRTAKIATIEARDADRLGSLDGLAMRSVHENLSRILGDMTAGDH